MFTLLIFFTVLFGLAFGSFLNVCISRLPAHASIVHPPSHCPRCLEPIRPADNIPLLSFLLLRGRCRTCRRPIARRYPLVELATAALFLLCILRFGLTGAGLAACLLCFLLLGLSIMDAETLTLPDLFTLPGIVAGIAFSGIAAHRLQAAAWSLLYATLAAAAVLLIRALYFAVRRQEGMGLGDVKLCAMIAAWLGPARGMLAFFLAVITAAIYGVALAAHLRGSGKLPRLPLGAFLSAAALYSFFYGQPLIRWYVSFYHR